MSAPVLKSKQGTDRPVASSTLQRILSRLQDSRDYEMHLIVITLTLLFDVALTAAIIARVPCTLPPHQSVRSSTPSSCAQISAATDII